MKVKLGLPNVELLEQSECKISCGLMAGQTDLSLVGMATPFRCRDSF